MFPAFVWAKLGVDRVGLHALGSPHLLELELVRPGQTLVLQHDDVVQVAHELACGEVGGTGQDKRLVGMVGVADDELVVHATPFTVGARVGHHRRVKAVEADVGVLTFINPTNLNAIGRGGIHSIFYGLVVQIVGSHIQRVLRAHDPRSHGVVHVCAQRQRKLVGGHLWSTGPLKYTWMSPELSDTVA